MWCIMVSRQKLPIGEHAGGVASEERAGAKKKSRCCSLSSYEGGSNTSALVEIRTTYARLKFIVVYEILWKFGTLYRNP